VPRWRDVVDFVEVLYSPPPNGVEVKRNAEPPAPLYPVLAFSHLHFSVKRLYYAIKNSSTEIFCIVDVKKI
jgi:hypothetical protein